LGCYGLKEIKEEEGKQRKMRKQGYELFFLDMKLL